jgi:hypothetical protein
VQRAIADHARRRHVDADRVNHAGVSDPEYGAADPARPGSELPDAADSVRERARAAVQVVTLDGMNFDPNLTVTITEPDGVTIVLSASQLTSVTATSVQFGKVFTKAGIYNFVVAIPSGEISNPVQINAV